MTGAMAQWFNYKGDGAYNLRYTVNVGDSTSVICMGMVNKDDAGAADLVIPATVINDGTTYSVTSIGDGAFEWCGGFTGALTIGDKVESIGESAFSNCSGFTGPLTIGAKVESIGESAFSNCSGFTGPLTIGAKVESIGTYAFESCSSLAGALNIPESVTSIGMAAFMYCSSLAGSLTIGNSVTSIWDFAFAGCSKLEGVTLPNDLTEIKSALFQGCTELATINFPDNIVKIGGKAAFSDTKWFADQAGGAVYIGKCLYAYKGTMDANTTITVNDGTTQICGDAFKVQTNLVAIILPESLKRISSYAFDGCSALAEVTMLSAKAPFVSDQYGAFDGIAADAKVYVPAGAKAAYDGEDADGLWQGFTIVDETPTSVASAQVVPFTRIQNTLYFAQPTAVAVYNVSGVMLHSGEVMEYTLPNAAGVYIIRTANSCVKVMK